MGNVLVAGVTGRLGRHVAAELKARGWRVRGLARNPDRLPAIGDIVDEAVIADVTDAAAVRGACDGIDAVISTIGINRRDGRRDPKEVDYRGNLNLLRQAARRRVERFVHISAPPVDALRDLPVVRAKDEFVRDLRASGLAATVLCPTTLFESMLGYLRMARAGYGYVIGRGAARINPIHATDLAALCADALVSDLRQLAIGGPDTFTHREILALAFASLDRRPRISNVPAWLGQLSARLLGGAEPEEDDASGPIDRSVALRTTDVVATAYGSRRLADFFAEHARPSLARPNGGAHLLV
jgi:uncharacterized protein YbjT (DUF2867 family)